MARVIAIVLLLTACNGIDRPVFTNMSESALATYNAGQADNDKVVCFGKREGWIGGSYRRIPNICLTVGQIIQGQRGWGDWAGAGYGNSGGGNHQPADAADYPSTFGGN